VPSISAQKRNGNIVGYSVYLGTEGDERRVRKFFPKLPDAEKFIAGRTQSPVPVGELWEKRMEILYNLDRLRSVGTTLTEVVSFYLNHRVGPSSLKLTEVLEKFLTEKKQVGRSPNYEHRMTLFAPAPPQRRPLPGQLGLLAIIRPKTNMSPWPTTASPLPRGP
jgi:hypothetical protein